MPLFKKRNFVTIPKTFKPPLTSKPFEQLNNEYETSFSISHKSYDSCYVTGAQDQRSLQDSNDTSKITKTLATIPNTPASNADSLDMSISQLSQKSYTNFREDCDTGRNIQVSTPVIIAGRKSTSSKSFEIGRNNSAKSGSFEKRSNALKKKSMKDKTTRKKIRSSISLKGRESKELLNHPDQENLDDTGSEIGYKHKNFKNTRAIVSDSSIDSGHATILKKSLEEKEKVELENGEILRIKRKLTKNKIRKDCDNISQNKAVVKEKEMRKGKKIDKNNCTNNLRRSKKPKIGKEVENVQKHEESEQDLLERMKWLRSLRNVGLYVFCDGCDKIRYLPNCNDPLDLPEKWYCHLNPDVNYNKCTDPEYIVPPEIDEKLIENEYNAGSIVWAKIEGWPWWPAMVEDDPCVEDYYWLEEHSIKPTWYHVTFFDTAKVTRAWIRTKDLKPYKVNATNPLYQVDKFNKYRKRIDKCMEQADNACNLPLKDRVEKYTFIYRYKGSPKKDKAPKRLTQKRESDGVTKTQRIEKNRKGSSLNNMKNKTDGTNGKKRRDKNVELSDNNLDLVPNDLIDLSYLLEEARDIERTLESYDFDGML